MLPPMPYGYLARMTPDDLDAVILYLRSLPPPARRRLTDRRDPRPSGGAGTGLRRGVWASLLDLEGLGRLGRSPTCARARRIGLRFRRLGRGCGRHLRCGNLQLRPWGRLRLGQRLGSWHHRSDHRHSGHRLRRDRGRSRAGSLLCGRAHRARLRRHAFRRGHIGNGGDPGRARSARRCSPAFLGPFVPALRPTAPASPSGLSAIASSAAAKVIVICISASRVIA